MTGALAGVATAVWLTATMAAWSLCRAAADRDTATPQEDDR